ncbi:hypothetical protein Fleli_3676 [Bernardetia litoralis DSM 6794]|uniref:Uncharacterized protein n=1 Tax=Bernardetia litoralis (strain ATCC 23117 / DSM 6794 / NBRC 15988 / NCIMB 1366 / Fx l1 / Sio-4) TaxID=880071 RepID=I4APV5_BERLS|nr:hypothetical protein [Bernardetia litoralis]AFM05990.1 hypothetical protein Fleli_3676 [Bernardetia litoralis DSM 6794]
MKLQNNLIKSLFILFILSFFSFNQVQNKQIQSELDNFLDKFPKLESKITNEEFRSKIESESNIMHDFIRVTKKTVLAMDSKYIPIGKIETKKTAIILYGVAKAAYQKEQRLLYVHSLAIDKKSGEFIKGSLKQYLLVSGEIKDKKETYAASLDYRGEKIIFTNNTINQADNSLKKEDIATYTVDKKMIQIESRN